MLIIWTYAYCVKLTQIDQATNMNFPCMIGLWYLKACLFEYTSLDKLLKRDSTLDPHWNIKFYNKLNNIEIS